MIYNDNPIAINEGLINKFKEKPFKGNFSNMKFIVRKLKTEDVDIKKTISYIESHILPQIESVIDMLSNKYMPLIYKKNPEKFKEKLFKSCRSLVLSRELIGDQYYLSTTCSYTNTEIQFKGDISDDGQHINFKLFDVVTTKYQYVYAPVY